MLTYSTTKTSWTQRETGQKNTKGFVREVVHDSVRHSRQMLSGKPWVVSEQSRVLPFDTWLAHLPGTLEECLPSELSVFFGIRFYNSRRGGGYFQLAKGALTGDGNREKY